MRNSANDSARHSPSPPPETHPVQFPRSPLSSLRFRWLFLLFLCLSLGCQSTLRTTPFCRPVPKPAAPMCCPIVPPESTFKTESPLRWEHPSASPPVPSLLDTWKTSNPPVIDLPTIDTRSPGLSPSPARICRAVPLFELNWAPGSTTRFVARSPLFSTSTL
jgi:hypothetical protein